MPFFTILGVLVDGIFVGLRLVLVVAFVYHMLAECCGDLYLDSGCHALIEVCMFFFDVGHCLCHRWVAILGGALQVPLIFGERQYLKIVGPFGRSSFSMFLFDIPHLGCPIGNSDLGRLAMPSTTVSHLNVDRCIDI